MKRIMQVYSVSNSTKIELSSFWNKNNLSDWLLRESSSFIYWSSSFLNSIVAPAQTKNTEELERVLFVEEAVISLIVL
jgi:hypothetical protein